MRFLAVLFSVGIGLISGASAVHSQSKVDAPSVFAKASQVNGTDPFFQCLTYDRAVWSQKLGISKSDLSKFLDRKDKTYPPKDPGIRSISKTIMENDPNRIKFPFRKSHPCPNLTNGHSLSSRKVCQIYLGKKSVFGTLDNGGTYCLHEPGSGGAAVLPNVVCQRFGQNTLGLNLDQTSIFVRWTGPTHEAVCFYIKSKDVATIATQPKAASTASALVPPVNSCAWLVALMAHADHWREQADALAGDAAMARSAAREWRTTSLNARDAAEYAKASGLESEQRYLEAEVSELEKRAKEYETKAKAKDLEASVLRDKSKAEDLARPEHLKKWCPKYKKSSKTTFAPEAVQINLPSSNYHISPIDDREDATYEEHQIMYLDLDIYTASDIKQFVERWLSSQFKNDPTIVGAGGGLGRDMMVLAQLRPDLALDLLNKLRSVAVDDLMRVLELVKQVHKEAQDPDKIAGLFREYLNDYWMAKLTQAVERMQQTIERQIRLARLTTTGIPKSPGSKATGDEYVSVEAVNECPRFRIDTSRDIKYWRDLADIADAEANSARRHASRWRGIAKEVAMGADQAGKDGNKSSEKYQRAKADELTQRARDYAKTAEDRTIEAKSLRQKADAEEKKNCERQKTETHTAKISKLPNVEKISKPPKSASSPEQSKLICGPDITDNVLRVLEKMRTDYQTWSPTKQSEKCRDLYNPVTAGTAWDIKQMSPSVAPMAEWKFEVVKWLPNNLPKTYEEYRKRNFWFQRFAKSCAKPRGSCGFTVRFLGKCMHTQVVNYAQWGMLNNLCGLNHTSRMAARVYNVRTPHKIFFAQKIMADVGRAYEVLLDQALDYGDEKRQRNDRKSKLVVKFNQLASDPVNVSFNYRDAAACTSTCKPTAAETAKLKALKFDYKWGAFALR